MDKSFTIVNRGISMSSEIKKCPYCGEEIKEIAIKCKYCGEFLNKEEQKKIEEQKKMQRNTITLRNCFITALIVAAVVNLWEFIFGVKFSPGSGTFSHFIITTIVLTILFFVINMWARIFDKLSS